MKAAAVLCLLALLAGTSVAQGQTVPTLSQLQKDLQRVLNTLGPNINTPTTPASQLNPTTVLRAITAFSNALGVPAPNLSNAGALTSGAWRPFVDTVQTAARFLNAVGAMTQSGASVNTTNPAVATVNALGRQVADQVISQLTSNLPAPIRIFMPTAAAMPPATQVAANLLRLVPRRSPAPGSSPRPNMVSNLLNIIANNPRPSPSPRPSSSPMVLPRIPAPVLNTAKTLLPRVYPLVAAQLVEAGVPSGYIPSQAMIGSMLDSVQLTNSGTTINGEKLLSAVMAEAIRVTVLAATQNTPFLSILG